MHGHPHSLQMVESIKLDFDLWRFYGIIQFYVDLRASEIKSQWFFFFGGLAAPRLVYLDGALSTLTYFKGVLEEFPL